VNLLDDVGCHFHLDRLVCSHINQSTVVLEQLIEQLHLFVREVGHLVEEYLNVDDQNVHGLLKFLEKDYVVSLNQKRELFELGANTSQLILDDVR
jgi:hypothetical protein